jgi:predicted O-methyltransferase YrrM
LSAAETERGRTIVNCLRILAHTSQIDPELFVQCVEVAGRDVGPGFISELEQDQGEFAKMLTHVTGCKSALEIGSRYGCSIQRIAAQMEPGSLVVAVDLPYADGAGVNAEEKLRENIRKIAERGPTHLFLGDSHATSLVEAVRNLGPFDFVFIDGDHSYEGVKADWENYGPMGKVVAFHDIINNAGCFRLWNEVKKAGYRTVEYTESMWLGIGIVFKD